MIYMIIVLKFTQNCKIWYYISYAKLKFKIKFVDAVLNKSNA